MMSWMTRESAPQEMSAVRWEWRWSLDLSSARTLTNSLWNRRSFTFAVLNAIEEFLDDGEIKDQNTIRRWSIR